MRRPVKVELIVSDKDVDPRDYRSDEILMQYAEAMTDGDQFPPIRLFQAVSGAYWLADGFYRVDAARAIGAGEIEGEVTKGNKRDAILHSCSANATHGYRRTNADKRRAVLKLLGDKEWSRWSDGRIAKACRVSQPFVSTLRGELSHNGYEIDHPIRRTARGSQEYEVRLPQSKAQPRHEPERWALVHLYDDVDALYDHVVSTGVSPHQLLDHLNPQREARLRHRARVCGDWLDSLVVELARREQEAS